MVAIRTTELAAVFFATFENVRGTVIAYQYPSNYVSPSQFKEISNAVLPRAELAFRVITVEAFQHYVIGCPQRIESVRYQRNTLQFNICLVIKPKPCHILDDITGWQFANEHSAGGLRLPILLAYETLVLKINRFFYTLEEDCAFLSRCIDESTGEWTDMNMPCLDAIFEQLHADGICVYPFENSGSLYLRFSPSNHGSIVDGMSLDVDEEVLSDAESSSHTTEEDTGNLIHHRADEAIVVRGHQIQSPSATYAMPQTSADLLDDSVFVLVYPTTKRNPGNTKAWSAGDCLSQRLLPHIDGTQRLLELATLARVDISVARLCLTNLIQAGFVRALPAPNFLKPPTGVDSVACPISNAGWLGMPRLSVLLSDPLLGDACLQSVVTDFSVDFGQTDFRRIVLVDIFRVYTMLCGSPNFSLPHTISATPHLRFVDLPTPSKSELLCFSHLTDSSNVLVHQSTMASSESSSNQPLSVNFLHLVQFGEVNGLIRRIHCFPISDHAESVEPADNTAKVQDANTHDTANHPVHAPRVGHMTHPGQPFILPPIRSENESPPRNATELLDDKTWNAVRSSLCDGLHSVDSISAILSQELCQFGTPDSFIPSDLVMQLRENLMHRLLAKSSRDPISQPSQTTTSVQNGSSTDPVLPVGWTQLRLPHPVPSRLKDQGFRLASTSTDETISHSRARPNPLARQGHHLQRRVSSIPQGYSTGELRFLVERYAQDEKLHSIERKPSRHHPNYPQTQQTPVHSLYMIWR